jgi:hypothetical protein
MILLRPRPILASRGSGVSGEIAALQVADVWDKASSRQLLQFQVADLAQHEAAPLTLRQFIGRHQGAG